MSSVPGMKQVHILSCRNDECRRHMTSLVDGLEKQNVSCVWEWRGDYGAGGLYSKRFSKFYSECSCTIIHICPEIVTKMKRVEQVLKEDPEKSYFIRIACSPTELADFLLDFNVLEVSSDDAVQRFMKDLVRQTVGDEMASPVIQPASPDQPQDNVNGGDYVTTGAFEPLTPVLRMRSGNTCKPLIEKTQLSSSPTTEIKDILTDYEKLARKQRISNALPHLSRVTVPDLYKKKDILSLAQLACSQNPRLRFQALYTISLLLCEQGFHGFSQKQLQNTESVLFKALEEDKFDSLDSGVKFMDDFGCTELLVIVYVMVIVLCIMSCDHTEKCHVHVVSKRPLFHMKKSVSAPSLPSLWKSKTSQAGHPTWVKVLGTCFARWKEKTCACVSRQVSIFVTAAAGQDPSAKLPSEFRLPVLVASLVQSYKDMAPSKFLCVLKLLQKHSSERSKDQAQRELKRIMISSAVFGLNIFLQHCTDELTSSDNFEKICRESTNCMAEMLKRLEKESQRQCLFRMTSLLFHSNKAVRQHTGFLFNQLSFYHHNLWNLLLLETDSVLWPLLTFSKHKEDMFEGHHNWVVLPSTFTTHSALTHIHRPTATNHLRQNSTRDTHQDRYFRELECLKGLQHGSIVQLMAFHEQCCPQFYITEDYTAKVLQTVLVNRSKNHDWFSMRKLLQMLTEALEGIQFCHDHGIVHRNLTAASFFISSTGRVKLANFKQSRKLAGKEYVRDFECLSIPTRWSAPESHRLCFFSIPSDMWMVGHLMYEVLTHGRLPYADVTTKPDEDLMPMVVKGEKTLCYEPCIPTDVRSIIQQLTSLKEEDRGLQAREVTSRLQIEISKASDVGDERSFFPNLNLPGQAATEYKMGLILSLVEDYNGPAKLSGSLGVETPEVDESGYINFGPQRGLTHFSEPCPPDFTSEVWSVLTQETLPGVTQIIGHPQRNANGLQELPFAIPAQTLCSLKDAVLTRWLGKEIGPYIVCLRQLASVISQLHSRGIILCDFAADTVHVEKFPTDPPKFKVWVTSLPNIKLLPDYSSASRGSRMEGYVHLVCPHGADKRRRAAGEVLQYGQYSTASDVYCYSVLAWWVFNAFDASSGEQTLQAESLSPLDKIPESEVYENVAAAYQKPVLSKAACCPNHIYQRMKECWQSQRHDRPCIEMLEAYMTLQEPEVPITLEDLRRESGAFIEIDNRSESSDAESMYADISDYSDYASVGNPSSASSEVSFGDSTYGYVPCRSAVNLQKHLVEDDADETPSRYQESAIYLPLPRSDVPVVFYGENSSSLPTRRQPVTPSTQEAGEPSIDVGTKPQSPPKQKPPVAPKPKLEGSPPGVKQNKETETMSSIGLHTSTPEETGDETYMDVGAALPPTPLRSYRRLPDPPQPIGSGLQIPPPATEPAQENVSVQAGTPPALPPRTYQNTRPEKSQTTAGTVTGTTAGRSASRGTADESSVRRHRPPPPLPPQGGEPQPPPLPARPPGLFRSVAHGRVEGNAAGAPSAESSGTAKNTDRSESKRLSEEFHIYEDL